MVFLVLIGIMILLLIWVILMPHWDSIREFFEKIRRFFRRIHIGIYDGFFWFTSPIRLVVGVVKKGWEAFRNRYLSEWKPWHRRLVGIGILLCITVILGAVQITRIGMDEMSFEIYNGTLYGFISSFSVFFGEFSIMIELAITIMLGETFSHWWIDEDSKVGLRSLYEALFILLSTVLVQSIPKSWYQLPEKWLIYSFCSENLTVGGVLSAIPLVWLGLWLAIYLLRELIGSVLPALILIFPLMLCQNGLSNFCPEDVLSIGVAVVWCIAFYWLRAWMEARQKEKWGMTALEDEWSQAEEAIQRQYDMVQSLWLLGIAVVVVAIYVVCRLCF